MSKNERVIRTIIAGLVFMAIGVLATLDYEGDDALKRNRAPAAVTCQTCSRLAHLKKSLLSRPGSESVKKRSKKAEVEAREAGILRSAGSFIAGIYKEREVTNEELQAITLFLIETAERDGAGISLDVISEGLSVEKMNLVLAAIEGEIATLLSDHVLTTAQADAYRLKIAAFRSQGETEADHG